MPTNVKKNEHGRRIGESHPRAILSDHEANLLFMLLAEREALLAILKARGVNHARVKDTLIAAGLSLGMLAAKFEIHRGTVVKMARGERRCQTPRPYP